MADIHWSNNSRYVSKYLCLRQSFDLPSSLTGGLSTIVASYLARTRGSNEPELSIIRVKDLDQFIRECQAFILDSGHLDGHEHDEKVIAFRGRFEELLGNGNGYVYASYLIPVRSNMGSRERRLATV